jgi:outer membrane protein TolC
MQLFLPLINVQGQHAYHEVSLAAMGFGPDLVNKLAPLLPGGLPPNFSYIAKVNMTEGSVSLRQTLFSGPVLDVVKAAGALTKAEYYARMGSRGEVVQQVATAYLQALAAASDLDNARALEQSDKVLYDHTHEMHANGVAPNLDELRARVEWQMQQQRVIEAENAWEKSLILLKREIGLAPGQPVQLTDPTPYSDLALDSAENLRAVAYQNRQVYQALKAQLQEAKSVRSGYSHQRWPSLNFLGNYAATAVNGAGTNGNFVAMGELSFPIFREASLRGQIQVAAAEERSVMAQLTDLKDRIDQQVRTALMDVEATRKLVEVAQSNVELAKQALDDEKARYETGVDDNLPLVRAQSSLAAAETWLPVLGALLTMRLFAEERSTGMIELQYKQYLGN